MPEILIFLLGLSVGSFINVLSYRLPKGKSIWLDRSSCDSCKHVLSWLDLIPIISFFLLKGKCRYCRRKFSWQYPIVEATTAILFFLTYLYVFTSTDPKIMFPTLIYLLLIVSTLITIFIIDIKYRIIPDQLVLILLTSSFIYTMSFNKYMLGNFIISSLAMFSVFLVIFLVTAGRGMGFGDVKLSIFIGFFLGFPKVVVAFYLSFLTGAVFSLILLIGGKKKMKDSVPFGPFLVIGCLISYLIGSELWHFFINYLGLSQV